MTRVLLDTNVISSARRLDRQDVAFQAFMTRLPLEDAFIASISIAEIRFGIQRQERQDPSFAADLLHWLQSVLMPAYADRILPFDDKAAMLCGRLETPQMKPTPDGMIAAIALTHELTMVTRNVDDFRPFGGPLLNPWDPAAAR